MSEIPPQESELLTIAMTKEFDKMRLQILVSMFQSDPPGFAKDIVERIAILMDSKLSGATERLEILKPKIHQIFNLMEGHEMADYLVLAIACVSQVVTTFEEIVEEEEEKESAQKTGDDDEPGRTEDRK